MKFFSYICNCVALDTGMCGMNISSPHLLVSDIVAIFAGKNGEITRESNRATLPPVSANLLAVVFLQRNISCYHSVSRY